MQNTEEFHKCGAIFTVIEIGGDVPGGKEVEPVGCPCCGAAVRTERTSGTFRTSLVSGVIHTFDHGDLVEIFKDKNIYHAKKE